MQVAGLYFSKTGVKGEQNGCKTAVNGINS